MIQSGNYTWRNTVCKEASEQFQSRSEAALPNVWIKYIIYMNEWQKWRDIRDKTSST